MQFSLSVSFLVDHVRFENCVSPVIAPLFILAFCHRISEELIEQRHVISLFGRLIAQETSDEYMGQRS